MLDIQQAQELMAKLHKENPEFDKYGGLGYCGYASKLLQDELSKIGVSSQVIHGIGLRQTPKGRMTYTGVINVGRSITETSGEYADVKKILTQSKKTIENNLAHLVVLIDNKLILDPTSMQFLAPNTYSFNSFVDGWKQINKVDVKVLPVEKYFFRFQLLNKVKWIKEGVYIEDSKQHDKTTGVEDRKYNEFWKW